MTKIGQNNPFFFYSVQSILNSKHYYFCACMLCSDYDVYFFLSAMFMILQTSMQSLMLLHSNLIRMRQSKSWIVRHLFPLQLLYMVEIFQPLSLNLLPLPINHLHSSKYLINHLIQGATPLLLLLILLPRLRGDIRPLLKGHILLPPLRVCILHQLRGHIHLPLHLVMASHHQGGLIFNLELEDHLFLSSKFRPLEKSTCNLVSEDLVCLQGISPFRPTRHSLHHGHETEHCSHRYEILAL